MLLQNILKISSIKKLYYLISILFIVFVLIYSWMIQINIIHDEKEIAKDHMNKLATLLDSELEVSFADILSQYEANNLSNKEKIQLLNQEMQAIINRISAAYPDYGLGFYSKKLDSIVAIGPWLESSFLRKIPRTYPYFKSYVTGKAEYVCSGTSICWYGKSIYGITYPLYRNGEIIGHSWVNIKLDDIYAAANREARKIYFRNAILLVIILLLVRYIMKFFERQLYYISGSLFEYKGEINPNIIAEVKPIVEKIKQKRDLINKQEKELTRLERFHTVGEMAATLAHEVRNPLTTIDGYVQIMKMKISNYYVKEKLAVISNELLRVNSIISEYLSFAKDNVSEKEQQNLNEIIISMQPLLQSSANKDRKSIIFDLGDIPGFEMSDKRIRQLIFNISRNGLEAMDDGGNLEIRTYQEEEKVILAISDQGKGIPVAILDKIAKPFFTTKSNGTGLGLAVCYRIVEEHNGVIDIKTNKNGTTFKIKFTVK